MSERKVPNKYIPPEYDYEVIESQMMSSNKNKSEKSSCSIRMMLPMTVMCLNCEKFMSIGTKFNMRIQKVLDEDYLGIVIYRFYFKCKKCFKELTFKTDPKNHDYVCEWGIKKKPQIIKDIELAEEEYKRIKEKEIKENTIKAIELKQEDMKKEMEILDAIEDLKEMNKVKRLDVNELLLKNLQMRKEEDKKKKDNFECNDQLFISKDENLKNKYLNSKRIVRDVSSFVNKNSFMGNYEDEDEDEES